MSDVLPTEELRVDAALAHADPALPGVLSVLDEVLLRRWTGVPGARLDRLRYKPSTSLRAAVGAWVPVGTTGA